MFYLVVIPFGAGQSFLQFKLVSKMFPKLKVVIPFGAGQSFLLEQGKGIIKEKKKVVIPFGAGQSFLLFPLSLLSRPFLGRNPLWSGSVIPTQDGIKYGGIIKMS